MPPSIVETLGRMGAVFIAAMLSIPGVDFLVLQGEPVTGMTLLGLAAVVLLVSEYVSTPGDAVGGTAGRVVGWIAKPPDDEE